MNGFKQTSADELKVQVIIRRLEPAIRCRDEVAIGRGIQEATQRYGRHLMVQAWEDLSQAHEWLIDLAVEAMPQSMREEFNYVGYDLLASVVIDAGLRVEDHLRVTDNGVFLTHEGIAAIAATGFPNIAQLGKGNETLDGIGMGRSPFMHPLAESDPNNPDRINLWAASSLFVSAALGWVPDEPPTEQAMKIVKDAVISVSPNSSFEMLVSRARYDDRMLLKLFSLVHEGLFSSK